MNLLSQWEPIKTTSEMFTTSYTEILQVNKHQTYEHLCLQTMLLTYIKMLIILSYKQQFICTNQ
jgi:uncharacterized membrane protein (DUF485 family)